MRAAVIVVFAIGVCGVKDEDGAKDSEAAATSEAVEPETVNAAEPVQPPAPPPKPDVPGLDAALARAIDRVEDGSFRIDPFVATFVAEQLEATGGEPVFRRIAKKQVKAGVPAGYRVGKIEKTSVWFRLGFRQGDVVTKVGTAEPPLPKRLRKLLETVDAEVDVAVLRDGTITTLHYELAGEQSWHDYLAKTAGRKFEDEQTPEEVADASQGGKPIDGGSQPSSGGSHSSSSSSSSSHSSSSSSSSGGGKPTGGGVPTTPESIPVSCSSSSSCTVAKWYFDKVVSSSSQMRSQAKIASASGGYRLTWVKPGSGVHKLLFRSGDIITRVNGRNLGNQLEALSLYAGLKSTRTYKVNYTRGGRSLSKTIRIV